MVFPIVIYWGSLLKLNYLKQIFKLTRISIVLAVLPIFFLGSLFALLTGVEFSLSKFLWGFLILFLIEIGASFANDYFDYEADKYNRQFGFSGGSGVLIKYPELLPFAKWASIILMVSALILTIIFIWIASLPIWVIVYISVAIFFCWFYTAPPLRLVYRGFGELPHLLAGIMFPGWGYLILKGTIDLPLLLFAIPFGLLGLTVILNFEIPDLEADLSGGKKNLIVLKGRLFSFSIIMLLYALATSYFFVLAYSGWNSDKFNFLFIALLLLIPTVLSFIAVIKKPVLREKATKYAILNAIAGFTVTSLITLYFTLIFFLSI
jgi:1,4-dihydroxy-2-naphthoate octaprenyltransferase